MVPLQGAAETPSKDEDLGDPREDELVGQGRRWGAELLPEGRELEERSGTAAGKRGKEVTSQISQRRRSPPARPSEAGWQPD